jgi:urease accessory protein
MKDKFKFLAVSSVAGAGLLAAPAVFAHTFGAHGAGFAEGLAHPLLGADHVLAMVAVGLWAAHLGGRAVWRVPAAFLAAMMVGAGLAYPWAGVEAGVGASVLALGLLLAFAPRWPESLAVLAVALFGVFHGSAHGLEMPQAASPVAYGLGFLSATAALHGLGVGLGLSWLRGRWARRAGGAAIAALGLWMLAV